MQRRDNYLAVVDALQQDLHLHVRRGLHHRRREKRTYRY
jgi:hypothetical protein